MRKKKKKEFSLTPKSDSTSKLWEKIFHIKMLVKSKFKIRGPFEKFVDWWECAAVIPPSA
jgi:hypothetical protein